jgi:hypothetical protein
MVTVPGRSAPLPAGRSNLAIDVRSSTTLARLVSGALATTTVAAAAPTVWTDDVLRGPAAMNGSARGTALAMIVLGVPLLVTGQVASRRGARWAGPIWLGGSAFLLYNAVMLLFATPFNSLFLLYLALFSLALWTVITSVSTLDVRSLGTPTMAARTRRAIAVVVWVVAGLNALAWLRGIVAGLVQPDSAAILAGTGLTTAPGYIQDLAFWLPLMAVCGWWLWRGQLRGHLIGTALLVAWVAESVTIAVDQFMGAAADRSSSVVSSSMTPVFIAVALALTVPAVALLRCLRAPDEHTTA